MVSLATISAIRFGYGPAGRGVPRDAEAHLDRLRRGDRIARRYPAPGLDDAISLGQKYRAAQRAAQDGTSGDQRAELRRALLRSFGGALVASFARIAETDDPLRERLVWFWADHFTATPKNVLLRAVAGDYIDSAIRPHVTGRFADMLMAVITHPMMLVYLDQVASVGPGSRPGKRRGLGLNENLAREVMELHTLGVAGPYRQADVRALAELFTGLTVSPDRGFVFRPILAEPGAETVLGKTYGGQRAKLEDIRAVVEDLARHPATAEHVSAKLATHFVADRPDPDLVAAMVAAWQGSDGDLAEVTAAMLRHPAAWVAEFGKARQPMDYLAASIVALGIDGQTLSGLKDREVLLLLARPLRVMGQPFMQAPGPDGWPEAADHWITPQGLAARIAWSVEAARRVAERGMDPRAFVTCALGDTAGDRLKWAVGAAETRAEGLALVLASAEFNRR
jgi:uncharacterized protein (DUF1800 family)